jgi:hypothetical protein
MGVVLRCGAPPCPVHYDFQETVCAVSEDDTDCVRTPAVIGTGVVADGPLGFYPA